MVRECMNDAVACTCCSAEEEIITTLIDDARGGLYELVIISGCLSEHAFRQSKANHSYLYRVAP